MRILAVDAGNSRVKWGLHEAGAWVTQGWTATADARTLPEAWERLPRPELLVATNVAGPAVEDVLAAAARALGAPLRRVRARARQCGVRSGYEEPERLGADRWAALIGAWRLYGGPSLVVNAGTAMTADALSREGVFLGGIIVAGADLMREALARSTAGLGVEGGRFGYFPASTPDAIASGAVNALAGAVERMARFLRETGEGEPLIVLSGGAAGALEPALNGRVALVDNLVLEGIVHIAHDF
jgi:type III pantothenate kinase